MSTIPKDHNKNSLNHKSDVNQNHASISYEDKIQMLISSANNHRLINIGELFVSDDERHQLIDRRKFIKVNLPDSEEKFESGNGEGIWIQTFTEADLNIYANEKPGECFLGFLANHSIYYPELPWGTVIKVKNSEDKDLRPILDRDWISQVIINESNNTLKLEDRF